MDRDTTTTDLNRPIILLAEDDAGDQELTKRAIKSSSRPVDLRIVQDGHEALEYLLRIGPYEDPESSPEPHLILLDLNMPRINGRQVLENLRVRPQLARIPVVVLTTSNEHTDIQKSYDLGCNSFISKPVEIAPFMNAVRELGHYWFDLVALPRAHPVPASSFTSCQTN